MLPIERHISGMGTFCFPITFTEANSYQKVGPIGLYCLESVRFVSPVSSYAIFHSSLNSHRDPLVSAAVFSTSLPVSS